MHIKLCVRDERFSLVLSVGKDQDLEAQQDEELG